MTGFFIMANFSFTADSDPYKNNPLNEKSVDPDPFWQFSLWFRDAVDSGVSEPDAMFLATAGDQGIPSGRIESVHSFGLRVHQLRKGYEHSLPAFRILALPHGQSRCCT